MTFKQYLPWMAARLFLGSIFIVSGFLKLSEPVENFRGMILAYGVIPYAGAVLAAWTIPWVEFIPGICLVIGYFPRWAAAVLGVLAGSFVILIVAAKIHGTLPENCGCFGDSVHISPYQMLGLDSFNFVISVLLFRMKTHRISLAS